MSLVLLGKGFLISDSNQNVSNNSNNSIPGNYNNKSDPPPASNPNVKPKVFVVDSRSRANVVDEMQAVLASLNLDWKYEVQLGNWTEQASQLARQHPALLIVHWHTLREKAEYRNMKDRIERDHLAEVDLLIGIRQMIRDSKDTRLVFYSSSFANPTTGRQYLKNAAGRAANGDSSLQNEMETIVDKVKLLYWPKPPVTEQAKGNLRDIIRDTLNQGSSTIKPSQQ